MASQRSAAAGRDMRADRTRLQGLSDLLLSTDPRRRTRIAQWWVAVMVYLGCTFIVKGGLRDGPAVELSYFAWRAFLLIFLTGIYLALRSGWSERFADPALTTAQILLGVIGVIWAYVICGEARGMTLYPLLLIFAFGAFSLDLHRIMWLTVLSLCGLIAAVATAGVSRYGSPFWPLQNSDLRLDLSNISMIALVLPALSLIAGRLSIIRCKLHAQREALSEAIKQVQQLATHDDLTGLVNRRHIQERLAQEQRRFQRHGSPFSVAVIDLDFFKRINDNHGHAFGDHVLQAFAAEALATLRASDLIARWGGEEFLLLLPDTQGSQGLVILQRLLARMHAIPHGSGPPLTFSAGVTEYRRDETVEAVVARADAAMYAAKAAGRNAVRLAEPAPETAA